MSVAELVIATAIIEVIEALLQYSTTIRGTVYRLYNSYYSKGIIYFFAVQIGYIWIMFLSLAYNNLSWAIILALTLKIMDIFSKLDLINRVVINPSDSTLSEVLDMPIPFWVYLAGILTYPYLVYLAFSTN
jgi:hypothetical protein